MKIREKPTDAPARNVLVWGAPKSGKTLLSSTTAPRPVLLLNGDLPNATWLAHQSVDDGELLEVEIDRKAKMPMFDAVKEVESAVNGGNTGAVATIVLDPVSEIYLALLRELSDNAISPTLPTYQAVQTHVERLCRAICSSDRVNAVIVCHDLPVKDEGTGRVERLPATGTTNPALGRKLMGMVDVLAFTQAVDVEGGGRQFVATVADRFNVLGRQQPLNLAQWFAELALTPAAPVNHEEPSDEAPETPAETPESKEK